MRALYGACLQSVLGDSAIQQVPHSPFSIQLVFSTEPQPREEALIMGQGRSRGPVTMTSALQTLPSLPTSQFRALSYIPPSFVPCQLTLTLRYGNIFNNGVE